MATAPSSHVAAINRTKVKAVHATGKVNVPARESNRHIPAVQNSDSEAVACVTSLPVEAFHSKSSETK